MFLFLCWFSAGSQADNIKLLQWRLPLITDSVQYVDALNRIAILFYEQNVDSTLYYASQARATAKRLNYPQGMADATNNFGIAYDIKGLSPLALRYYNDAFNQYSATGDSANVVQTLMNIAMVYTTTGKTGKAIAQFKRAFTMGNRLTHDSIMSLVIYNYLLQYPDEFAADSVPFYINKAINIATRYHDRRLLLAVQQLKANNLLKTGKHDMGINLLQQTLTAGLNDQLFYMTLDILVELGDTLATTDSAKAVQYYHKALAITEQKQYQSYSQTITQKLYDFYTSKHDERLAFYYSRKLLQVYTDEQAIQNNSGIDYIEYAIKDQQLDAIEQKAAYNSRLLWLACIACALAVAVIFILWRNSNTSRKTHAVLQQQFTKLELTTMALSEKNAQYARLLKIVAHDLRNPISAISAISSIMLEDSKVPENTQWLEMIAASGKRCIQLIGELLETDFIITERSLNKQAVNLTQLLQQTIQMLSLRAREKKQHLLFNNNIHAAVQVDAEQLSRVFDNLLINAIKFSPEASTITLTVKQHDDGVVIAIADTGIGIPKKMARSVFDPFTQAKRKGTAGEETYGLGLYICKQVVEAHSGRIWFESEEGKGTTFFVLLPA